MEEFAKGLRLSRMIVEEWEEYKAKLKRTPVTGTINAHIRPSWNSGLV